MNKLLLALALLVVSINAYSGDAIIWNKDTKTLTVPSIVGTDGKEFVSSAKLQRRDDGLYELVDVVITPEAPVESCSNTPVGAFTILTKEHEPIYHGDIFQTTDGKMIYITGIVIPLYNHTLNA